MRVSLPVPPTRRSLPPLPVKVSLPAPPVRILLPLLPVILLARAFPVPSRLAAPVRVRFSALAPRVKETEALTVSVP
ncbi:MAG: hypothetical protein GC158_16545 [Cyanobacteria bacterium RI_101]|nr:hypothetical protein [Cyanobacteria bacterium RI_101]